MSKFIPKVVNGTLPEIQDGSMIFDKEAKKIYFDFDGQHQEVKSGEEYSAGTGIKIDNNVISVNDTVAKSADLTSEVTTARAAETALGTRIDNLTAANIAYTNEEIGEEVQDQKTFNDLMVDTVNNLEARIDTKQDKLPNATQVGQVLKATNTEGGIAWGEAGSGLPSTEDAKTGDALKVQLTPAVYKFTTSIVASDTPQEFFINTASDFDFSGIPFTEETDEGFPCKPLVRFGSSISYFGDTLLAVTSTDQWPSTYGLYIGYYSCGWHVNDPIYLASDHYGYYGDWTKGWVFSQTDATVADLIPMFKSTFPLDSSIPGNTIIRKYTSSIVVDEVLAGKDIRSSFSSANTVEKVSDATTSFKWESALPTGQNDLGQFYVSRFYKQTNLSELKAGCYGVGLDLTKVPDFSYFDTLSLETGEKMLVYTGSNYSTSIDGQGLYLYVSTAGETNTYALGLTLALDVGAPTAEDFKHFPLYATSACEFDHQFKASSGSTEVFNYHYSFSGAGWAQTESWIGSEADTFYINPVGDISSLSNLWNTVLNFGQCISFEALGGVFIFYPGFDMGNKFMSLETLGAYLDPLPGDVGSGYVYTDCDSYEGDDEGTKIRTIGYNCDTKETTSYVIPVPILPSSGRSMFSGITADAILLYDNSSTRTINNVEYKRKYKWLETPESASNNKVLTYNYSTSSVEWADGGSSGGGAVIINGTINSVPSQAGIDITFTDSERTKLIDAITTNKSDVLLHISPVVSATENIPSAESYLLKLETNLNYGNVTYDFTFKSIINGNFIDTLNNEIYTWTARGLISSSTISGTVKLYNTELLKAPVNASDGQVLTYGTGGWEARDISVTSMASENVTYNSSLYSTTNQKDFNTAIEENKQNKLIASTGITIDSYSTSSYIGIDTVGASNGEFLYYNNGSVGWGTPEAELPTYDESVINYNYGPSYITNGFDLSNLAANATYTCYFGDRKTVFTIYTDSYSQILHTDAIFSIGKTVEEAPCYTRLARTKPDYFYFVVDYYSGSSWQEASYEGSILRIKRIL